MSVFAKLIPLVFILLTSQSVHALKVGFEVGFSKGGDTVIQVKNGFGTLDQLVGDGYTVGVMAKQNLFSTTNLVATAGYKFSYETYSNGSSDIISFPVSYGINTIIQDKLGVEAGILSLYNTNISGSIYSSSFSLASSNSTYFAVNWQIKKKQQISVRYTNGLTLQTTNGTTLKSDHLTVSMRRFF